MPYNNNTYVYCIYINIYIYIYVYIYCQPVTNPINKSISRPLIQLTQESYYCSELEFHKNGVILKFYTKYYSIEIIHPLKIYTFI